MSKHIVTGIKPYDFIDDSGRHMKGVKVYYLDNEQEDSKDAKGYFPLNLSLIGDHVSKFVAVPGIYDLDFRQVPDKFGRPVFKLRSVEFIEPVELPTVEEE